MAGMVFEERGSVAMDVLSLFDIQSRSLRGDRA
jgi:hypothetical protein